MCVFCATPLSKILDWGCGFHVIMPALWGYIEPALDHIIRSQTNDPTQAPSIDVGYHMGIHTATYDYFTSRSVWKVSFPVDDDLEVTLSVSEHDPPLSVPYETIEGSLTLW